MGGCLYSGRGGKGTVEGETTREKGLVQKRSAWKNEKSGEGTSEYKREFNKETGESTSSRTSTNAKGQTATTTATGTKNEDGSYMIKKKRVGWGGKNQEGNTTIVKNDDGTITTIKTLTGEDGKTYTTRTNSAKTENGWEHTGDYETGDGKKGTYVRKSSKGETGQNVRTTVTNDQVQTYDRNADYTTSTDGTRTRSVTDTGPNGETRNWSGGYTPNE